MGASFAHIGMNHIVQTNRVLTIMTPNTNTAKRYMTRAKERGMLIDASLSRKHRSILLLDDGTVVISCIRPFTLLKRFSMTPDQFPETPEEDDAMELLELDEEDGQEE